MCKRLVYLELQLLFPSGHARGFVDFDFDDRHLWRHWNSSLTRLFLNCKCHNETTVTYLISKRNSEIQHLATQFPFTLILHVGNLHFNCHGTLGRNKRTMKQICLDTDATAMNQASKQTLFLRRNSSSGIRLSSDFIFLLTGSSSRGGGGWIGGAGTTLGGCGTGGAGTNATEKSRYLNWVMTKVTQTQLKKTYPKGKEGSFHHYLHFIHLTSRNNNWGWPGCQNVRCWWGNRDHINTGSRYHGRHLRNNLAGCKAHHRSHWWSWNYRHSGQEGGAYWWSQLFRKNRVMDSWLNKVSLINSFMSGLRWKEAEARLWVEG